MKIKVFMNFLNDIIMERMNRKFKLFKLQFKSFK